MLDAHLADLYNVPTKALIQALRRNLLRFPHDFAFQLTKGEHHRLRSQIVTPKASRMNVAIVRFASPYCYSQSAFLY